MNKDDAIKHIRLEIRCWEDELNLARKNPEANARDIPFYSGMKQGLQSALDYLVME